MRSKISTGFWDVLASGGTWEGPAVLAALSATRAGSENMLVLATDGSRDGSGALQYGRIFGRFSAELVSKENSQKGKRLFVVQRYTTRVLRDKKCLFALSLQVLPDVLELPRSPSARCFAPHPTLGSTATADSGEEPSRRPPSAPAAGNDGAIECEGKKPDQVPLRGSKNPRATKRPRGAATSSASYQYSKPGAIARLQAGRAPVAIKDINPYTQDWVMRGRVADKTTLRLFANQRGEGQVFSATIIDQSNGEIRATFFGQLAALWHPRLEVGRVYEFSRGTVDLANKRFNSASHDYELKFDDRAQIHEAEDDLTIPSQLFFPKKLSDITSGDSVGSVVDVIGFVASFSDTQTVVSRTTRQDLKRKELTIVDDSGDAVAVTLWEKLAGALSDAALSARPLLAIKAEYGGKICLSSTSRSVIQLDPQGLAAAEALRDWWEGGGRFTHKMQVNTSHSSVTTDLLVVRSATRGLTSGSLYFNCAAVVSEIDQRSVVWLACPECNRKVRENRSRGSGAGSIAEGRTCRCLNCNRDVVPQPQWSLSVTLADPTGSLQCTAFGEGAQELMGPLHIDPPTIYMLERGGTDTFGRAHGDIFELLLYREVKARLCVRCYEYYGEQRVTCKMVSCSWLERSLGAHSSALLRCVRDRLEVDVESTSVDETAT
ncbi:replication protein a 70 kda dna-binding, partial [Cystoisospora suis]